MCSDAVPSYAHTARARVSVVLLFIASMPVFGMFFLLAVPSLIAFFTWNFVFGYAKAFLIDPWRYAPNHVPGENR